MLSYIIRYLREWHYEDIQICAEVNCSICNKNPQYCVKPMYCLSNHQYCGECSDNNKITCRQCNYYLNIKDN